MDNKMLGFLSEVKGLADAKGIKIKNVNFEKKTIYDDGLTASRYPHLKIEVFGKGDNQ